MRKFAEFLAAKWVVSQILYNRAAIGVGMSFLDLVFSYTGKAFDEEGPNPGGPCQVYDLLVSQNGVGKRAAAQEQQRVDKDRRAGKPQMPWTNHRVGFATQIWPRSTRTTMIARTTPIPLLG